MSADHAVALRRATAGDADRLSLVASACFLETYIGIVNGADMVAHCAAKLSPDAFARDLAMLGVIATIAEAGEGVPIGYTMLTAPDLPVETGPGDIELRRIYLLSRFHGGGQGRAMMEQAIDDARAAGFTRLLLGVAGVNHNAHAFYERQGFTRIGTRRFLVGQTWHDDFVYARGL